MCRTRTRVLYLLQCDTPFWVLLRSSPPAEISQFLPKWQLGGLEHDLILSYAACSTWVNAVFSLIFRIFDLLHMCRHKLFHCSWLVRAKSTSSNSVWQYGIWKATVLWPFQQARNQKQLCMSLRRWLAFLASSTIMMSRFSFSIFPGSSKAFLKGKGRGRHVCMGPWVDEMPSYSYISVSCQ
jgi:hypothetical protein